MNAATANLFLAIQERIKTQVPAIRWIDQDLGQFEYWKDRPAVSFPCVLIDIDDFEYVELGELARKGEGNIRIRLGFPPYSASHQLTPTQTRERALEFYNIEFNLFKALHGWCPDNDDPEEEGGFGSLICTNQATERRDDPIRVRINSFSVSHEDYSAKRPFIVIVGEYSKKEYNGDDYDTGPKLEV